MPPRLPCYTEAELRSPHGPNLPGLWTPAQIDIEDPYAFFRSTDWQPVLNLAVVTEEISYTGVAGLGLLAGSRPETEQTHPNVVSTPTQWITDHRRLELMLNQHFFDAAMRGLTTTSTGLPINPEIHLNEINPSHFAVIGHVEPYPVNIGGITSPLGGLTQKLLAEKLGFDGWYAPDNERQLAKAGLHPSIGSVSMSRLLAGFSYVGENENDEPLYEPIVMVGAVVHTPFPKLFPRSTSRYDNLTFTSLSAFPKNVKNREVENLIQLDSELDQVMMCVRGLCLSTNVEMSSGPDLARHSIDFEVGVTYNVDDATDIADLLVKRDRRGEQLAVLTNRALGWDAFAGRRIALERADMSARSLSGLAKQTANDEHAEKVLDQLDYSLATAGRGFAFFSNQ